jgi:hypothetical protein
MSDVIPFVISRPYRQRVAVDRLVRYCKELDGTEITVVPISEEEDAENLRRYPTTPGNSFPRLQACAFRKEAERMRGSPWGHIEPDSIPLKPGWAKALTDEYRRLEKPFMLSSDSHPPGDLVGGIGIFPGNAHEIVPIETERDAWDMWMIRNIPELISKTPLIQHKYAKYPIGAMDKERDLVFPKDQHLIRKDAVIFHRDVTQSLIPKSAEKTFWMSGDIGDCIASMAVVRQLGGGRVIIGDHPKHKERGWRKMSGGPYEALAPLLKTLPYVSSVEFDPYSTGHDYDFSEWRQKYRRHRSLAHSQADYFDIANLDVKPWIIAISDSRTKGRIVVGRSPRYHNHSFPWIQAVKRYRDRLVFLGLKEEHAAFEEMTKRKVEFIPTKDFKEIAGLVSGCDFIIANQSSIGWVALAMGKKLIQETYIKAYDSRIDERDNQYVEVNHVIWPK